MDSPKNIRLTKLEAARRQLRTAIELWFFDGDPVAIYTLAYAAHEIINHLFLRRGLSDLLFDSSLIKGKHRNKMKDALKAQAAFMKHADKDPDGMRGFNPSANEGLILFSVAALSRMDEKMTAHEVAFSLWIGLHRASWISSDISKDFFPIDSIDKLRNIKKSEFIATVVLSAAARKMT